MKINGIKLPRIKSYVVNTVDADGHLVCKSRYAKKTNKLLKDVFFYNDGKTISSITHYNPNDGSILQDTFFSTKGKYLASLSQRDYDVFK